jgi:NADP-dependent 3-hydroxy acid dehydrogenase YdfG
MTSAFLINKVVLITGSGSGIGKTTAEYFCKHGASVMLNGRDEAKLKQTSGELKALGYSVEYFTTDITNYKECKELVAFTIKTFGTINVLVTNASISMNARFDEIHPELFKKILDSNIYGTAFPLFSCLDILKQTKGSVVFISSVAGLYGMPTASAYSAGKMALTAMHQSLRSELHSSGIHFGILYVGFTKNNDDKKLMNANGDWLPVPKRPRFLQQSQKDVALSVINMVRLRTKQKTLSLAGKSTFFMAKFFPGILGRFAVLSQRK